MKKFMTNSLLLLFLFIAFATKIIGGDPPPVPQIGAIVSSILDDPEFNPESCTFTVPFRVVLTNLEGFLPPPDQNGFESIPDGYDEMYLEYTVNSGPLTYVKVENLAPAGSRNNISVYETIINSYPVDIEEACSRVSTAFYMPYAIRLVTPDKDSGGNPTGTYSSYPMSDHRDVCDIFSCEVDPILQCEEEIPASGFYCDEGEIIETSGYPNSNPGNYSDGPDIALPIGNVYVYCKTCKETVPMGGNEHSDGQEEESPSIPEITVSPNPFSNNMNVKWFKAGRVDEIALFDISGKLTQRWDKKQLGALTSLNVNTERFAKGVYFLKVKSADATEVIKVVKQ